MTLVGPGGVGKTRLVTRVATAMERSFPTGTAFAELGALPESIECQPPTWSSMALYYIDGHRVPRFGLAIYIA
jgi:predicted ATPase